MAESKPHISVVIPLYRCSECIPELHRRLTENLSKLTAGYEIILVNDASPDPDWELVRGLAIRDKHIKGINLARNFGQHYAITAGLDVARGDWVVVMDGDLQHPPEEIEKLYRKAQEGFDIVFGMLAERHDHWFKKFASNAFAKVYNFFSEVKVRPATSNFSIASDQVVRAYRQIREQSRAYGLIISWLGFNVGYVTVEHGDRFAGRTTYTLGKSIALAIDSVVSQSSRPLRLSMVFGFCVSLISFLIGLWLVLRKLVFGVPVAGWASVMVSIYFIGGLLFANLGVVGIYLGKVFDETKGRPLYVVRATLNLEEPVE